MADTPSVPVERDPSKTFANPFIACTSCGVRVYWWTIESGNDPCGHSRRDTVDPWQSVCPSWSPVDGCQCQEHLGHVGHGTPGQSGQAGTEADRG